ncbi:MAG: hypothetical protein CMG50_00055 [Candidatus Marinimicrobia bacterium]|nr:hypothetical protein [Candidatus Neomarinimicrobiota bacterium]MBV19718.1 hypothetical protein [Cytophagia bacterium]|tara:strand:- start:434 stop:796 length:363 start_codon:yes stop_codon:yes gene_type:complete
MYKTINDNLEWLLRLPVIGTFLYHGYPKLGTEVANLGYVGYLVGPFEFFGAIFLLVGPFINDKIHRAGALMISVIMVGAIYMHLFKWNDTLKDVEWQILLLAVSLYFAIKDCDLMLNDNE